MTITYAASRENSFLFEFGLVNFATYVNFLFCCDFQFKIHNKVLYFFGGVLEFVGFYL